MKIRIFVDEYWPVFGIETGENYNENDLIDIPDAHMEYYKKVMSDYNHMQAKLKELYDEKTASS